MKQLNNIIIETERLYLRKLQLSDMQALRDILQDKEVMYAYEHGFSDEEVVQWYERQQERYVQDGVGLLAVILKSEDKLIGQCGLTLQDYKDKKVYEIGYLFNKSYWHNGYAVESAAACKKYAFQKLKIDEVYSIIRTNNYPSQKVAERNGMTVKDEVVKHYYNIDMPHYVYSIKNPLI